MYKYLFGPVPSRRLGMSLGVDLVTHKICSLNCVYCECGETTDLTTKRGEYVSFNGVITELADYFKNNPEPDYITFSGSGEPCLNTCIGDVIDFIKKTNHNISIAVLTNGTLLYKDEVRRELLKADLVIPSLDAALENTFQKINKPSVNIDLSQYIQGLQDFKSEYKGNFILEVLIIPGWNDHFDDLEKLRNAIGKIQPDKVQLNTLDRPGAVLNIYPASSDRLQQIAEYLGGKVEIIASVPKQKTIEEKAVGKKKIKPYRKNVESVVLETISRRPCTLKDLAIILNSRNVEISKYLSILEKDGKIELVRQKRGLFYQIIST